MATLSDGTTTVTISDDLFWSDEHEWNPVEQTAERTITGALIVQAAANVAGRPITLQPDEKNDTWHSREVIDQLRNFAAVPGLEMTLTLRGTPHEVIFRHHDGVAVEATPVVHYSDVQAEDNYLLTLRLMEL